MTFNEIEKKAFTLKGKTINPTNTMELNANIIEILKMCINQNIKLDLNEKDFIKIINIYYLVYHVYYDDFLKQVAGQSIQKLNFVEIINRITE